jgi:thymidine phosphorylase
MIAALGGPADLLEAPDRHLPRAPVTLAAAPNRPGIATGVDVRAVGLAVLALGGGRRREDDRIDPAVGLTEVAAPGELVGPGERPLALVHAASVESAERAAQALRDAYTLGEHSEVDHPIVLEVLR